MLRRTTIWLSTILLLLLVAACCPWHARHGNCGNCSITKSQAGAMNQAGVAETRHDVLYTCDCGKQCNCNSVSTKPGNCSCGKPMVWGHVVKVEGNEALLCTCAEGCKCQQDANDPSKCSCGKPLKRVSLAGTGVFFCNCGGSCTCNTVSDQAGNCRCGMPLKQQ
jgi:hypothetical protein